jgi:hypothetical protein
MHDYTHIGYALVICTYSYSSACLQGAYGDKEVFLKGLTQLGFPSANLMEGQRQEWKEGPDSQRVFLAYNSEKNEGTPEQEWDFVVCPFTEETLSLHPRHWLERHTYGGIESSARLRKCIRLAVFLYVCSARDRHGREYSDFEGAVNLKMHTGDGVLNDAWLHGHEVYLVKFW